MSLSYKTPAFALLLCAASSLVATAVAAALNYHVGQRYVLGGDGGWDYLTYDPDGKRLFISRSSHVMVVDPTSGKLIGDIPNTPGVHGIAIAPLLGRGFTSNGADGSVGVFDLRTFSSKPPFEKCRRALRLEPHRLMSGWFSSHLQCVVRDVQPT